MGASKDNRILDSISSPADLHCLDDEELRILASEIRSQIVSTTSKTGGHVASSLGAVEIILAIHSVLNAPKDKVVFDVGHQAYAHKLVTGRLGRFDELRQFDGISGFPRPSESPYDTHPSGHASDSLSVASGFAKAKLLNGSDEKIVAVIGDAALAGGMAFEALNMIGSQQLPLVIILNDNEMSISKNVGALMKHLGNIRATSGYRETREALQERLESGGRMSNALAEFGKRMKDSTKHMFIPHAMIYEQLGIVCTAPIDGHNIHELKETLRLVADMDAPVLMHVITKKGAGYGPAEMDSERFHGIGPYNPDTSESLPKSSDAPTYTEVFGRRMVEEAKTNPDIVAITAAMEGGTGLKGFHFAFPERFIDVGIAEEQAVGMASGLAAAGKRPVVAIYSTFMQRAFDQMAIDVSLPRLNVVFAIDRAGLVGDDGPTHHGVFDMAYCRMIPNMRVIAPSDENELSCALHTALRMQGPVAIRYPRGSGAGASVTEPRMLEEGKSRVLREGKDVSILAFGRMVHNALAAAEQLYVEGIDARVVDMRWVKPLDVGAIEDAAASKLVVTVEEGCITGGAGEGVLEILSQMGSHTDTLVLGIPDNFVMQGRTELLFEHIGLDISGIVSAIKDRLR